MIAHWIQPNDLDLRLDSFRYSPDFLNALHRVQKVDYPKITIGDTRDPKEPINYGILQPREFLENDGAYMVRAVDLQNPFVDRAKVVRVPSDVEQPYRRSRLAPGDVLISIAGSLGAIGIAPQFDAISNINQSVARIRPAGDIDGYYLATYLMSELGQVLLAREAVGSVQRHFNLEDIPNVVLPNPPCGLQQAIGNKVRKAERLRALAASCRVKGEQWLSESIQFHPPVDSNRPTWSDSTTTGTQRFDAEYYGPTYLALDHFFVDWQKSGKELDRLKDLIQEGGYGVLPSSVHYGQGDLKFLRAQDVGSLLINESVDLVVPGYYANKKAITKANDVLLEVKGEISGCAVCPAEMAGCLLNGSIYRMAVSDSINPYYLAAFLISPTGRLQKKRAAANSVISYLSVDFLNDLRIPRLGDEKEEEIGSAIRMFVDFTAQSKRLVEQARNDVEALIEGTLDEATLSEESAAIEKWLEANPTPKS